jgi:hypothetical protein
MRRPANYLLPVVPLATLAVSQSDPSQKPPQSAGNTVQDVTAVTKGALPKLSANWDDQIYTGRAPGDPDPWNRRGLP